MALPVTTTTTPFAGRRRRARASALAPLAAFSCLLALAGPQPARAAGGEGLQKIQHVIVIMQENRSFDTYFGTYPGANGIPSGVCVPDPLHGGCVRPFHTAADVGSGGPHGTGSAIKDINGGKMDGFVATAEEGAKCESTNPACVPCKSTEATACVDVMGYHDAREIPNYWEYAKNFVLQDNMFEPVTSWSLAAAPVHGLGVVGGVPERRRKPARLREQSESGPSGRRLDLARRTRARDLRLD